MSAPDTRSWLSGGCYLTRLAPRPRSANAALVPARIVTLSPCLTELLPGGWAIPGSTLERDAVRAMLTEIGLEPASAESAERWLRERAAELAELWPCAFPTAELARAFAARFASDDPELWVVGAALAPDRLDALLAESLAPGDPGGAPLANGVLRRRPREAGGVALGFELLGDGLSEQHSPLCNGLETELLEELGVRLNRFGLIESYDEALRAARWITEEERGEPVAWFPWELRRYDVA